MDLPGLRPFATLEEWLDDWTSQKPEFAIVSKRCRICQSAARVDIDILTVAGRGHDYVAGFFNAFRARSASTRTSGVGVDPVPLTP